MYVRSGGCHVVGPSAGRGPRTAKEPARGGAVRNYWTIYTFNWENSIKPIIVLLSSEFKDISKHNSTEITVKERDKATW